jgi:DNA-binding response OmpR family regulator
VNSILIAENESVAQMFAYISARCGWTAAAYQDGQRAVAEFARRSFDAVLVSN